MKTIENKTRKPLRVPLPGGKFLHLGPLKSARIADGAASAPAVQRLVKSGDVDVYDEDAAGGSGGAHGKSGSGQNATQGHTPTKIVRPSGDR